MRQFSAEYLAETRAGLWTDREALGDLDLPGRERVLDVGCGTGSLATVLREESDAEVLGLDADRSLLGEIDDVAKVRGDAFRMPFADRTFDLVTCQALLVNLPDPLAGVRELARVSTELVAAVEPDNAGVTVESSVRTEAPLAARARSAYLDGLDTDGSLGARTPAIFESAGLRSVTTTRHDMVREIAPPYGPDAIESAKRKVTASRLRDQEPELRDGGLGGEAFDGLVEDWKTMGRAVVQQMGAEDYRRTETVPFYVTVGRV
ncbi:MAG: class I SAM-dependent methyltransferase [Halobacteriales archaeon]